MLFLVFAFFFVAVAAETAPPASPVWTHGWDNALGAQFIDFGYQALSDAQAMFVASHYQIVSLEKCTGNPTELTVWEPPTTPVTRLQQLR